jgi:hypothetical protein
VSARSMTRMLVLAACGAAAALPAFAQARQMPVPKPDPQVAARYQLAIMADVLERAVQQGARLMSRQLPMSQMMLVGGDARARGFRLDGYGIFFDVDVPAMRQSVVWSWRMLDMTGGGASGAIDDLKAHLKTVTDPAERRTLDQAIRQLELQLGPSAGAAPGARPENAQGPGGQPTVVALPRSQAAAPAAQPGAPVVAQAARAPGEDDPGEAYTVAVREALIDAMLRYSQSLALGADEWLVVAARDRGEPGVGSDDPFEVTTIQLRIKGADLQAFHAGRLTQEEARTRVEVREY